MTSTLRPALREDRRQIYNWLARSDATAEMMGPPRFDDHPVPSWEEFCDDYNDEAFEPSGGFRLFVITIGDLGIGAISSYLRDNISEIDLWIGDREYWGKGYGSAAIRQIAEIAFADPAVAWLIIRPSVRNPRAIAAYRKAGFTPIDRAVHDLPEWVTTEGLDYEDAVTLVWPRA